MSTRPKKTIVVKTVERRSPDGKLLSTTKSKTVYLEEKPISEILPQTKTQFVYVGPIGKQVLGVEHENEFTANPVIAPIGSEKLVKELDKVKRELPSSSATIYNYKWEPRRIFPYSQILMSNDLDNDGLSSERTRYIGKFADGHRKYAWDALKTMPIDRPNVNCAGDSTIYADDWSSTAGTCLKQSKLIRRSECIPECSRSRQPCSHCSSTPIDQWLHKLHSSHK